MKTIYYVEWPEATYGFLPPKQKYFNNDTEAIIYYKNNLNCPFFLYKENTDTEDGTPFIEVYNTLI